MQCQFIEQFDEAGGQGPWAAAAEQAGVFLQRLHQHEFPGMLIGDHARNGVVMSYPTAQVFDARAEQGAKARAAGRGQQLSAQALRECPAGQKHHNLREIGEAVAEPVDDPNRRRFKRVPAIGDVLYGVCVGIHSTAPRPWRSAGGMCPSLRVPRVSLQRHNGSTMAAGVHAAAAVLFPGYRTSAFSAPGT